MGAGRDGRSESSQVEAIAVIETARAKKDGFDIPFFRLAEQSLFGITFKDVNVRGEIASREFGAVIFEDWFDPIFNAIQGPDWLRILFPVEQMAFQFLVDDSDELNFCSARPVAIEGFFNRELRFQGSVDTDHYFHCPVALIAVRADDANGAESFGSDFKRNTAEEEFFEGVAAMRADDDEVGIPTARFGDDAPGWRVGFGGIGDGPTGEDLMEAARAFDGGLLGFVKKVDGFLVKGGVSGVGRLGAFGGHRREPDVGKARDFGFGAIWKTSAEHIFDGEIGPWSTVVGNEDFFHISPSRRRCRFALRKAA